MLALSSSWRDGLCFHDTGIPETMLWGTGPSIHHFTQLHSNARDPRRTACPYGRNRIKGREWRERAGSQLVCAPHVKSWVSRWKEEFRTRVIIRNCCSLVLLPIFNFCSRVVKPEGPIFPRQPSPSAKFF